MQQSQRSRAKNLPVHPMFCEHSFGNAIVHRVCVVIVAPFVPSSRMFFFFESSPEKRQCARDPSRQRYQIAKGHGHACSLQLIVESNFDGR